MAATREKEEESKALLAAKYRPYGVCKDARSIVVIHNLAHQQGYSWEITTPEGGYGPRELFDQFEQLSGYVGITNGIDVNEWDPSSNQHIPSHYSIKDLSGMVNVINFKKSNRYVA
ncbi:hypothetical protein LguiB_001735 [Lonicera macranthoides]